MHEHVCVCLHLCVCVCLCVLACMYPCIHACVCVVCSCLCICTCACIRMCVYACRHVGAACVGFTNNMLPRQPQFLGDLHILLLLVFQPLLLTSVCLPRKVNTPNITRLAAVQCSKDGNGHKLQPYIQTFPVLEG